MTLKELHSEPGSEMFSEASKKYLFLVIIKVWMHFKLTEFYQL